MYLVWWSGSGWFGVGSASMPVVYPPSPHTLLIRFSAWRTSARASGTPCWFCINGRRDGSSKVKPLRCLASFQQMEFRLNFVCSCTVLLVGSKKPNSVAMFIWFCPRLWC